MSVLRRLFSLTVIDRTVIDREQLLARLRDDLEEDLDEILEAQALYATMGIIDRDTNLYDLLLGLYGEQVVGLFDTEEEKLFLVKDAGGFGPADIVTYAHEFVHALQQQHFDIHSTQEGLEDNSDASRAFHALVEGDATISEILYAFEHLSEEDLAAIGEAALSSVSSVALEAAPHVIQRGLYFPYVEGAQFVTALYFTENDWGLVNEAYADLPQSTEQVLHPEKYIFREEPATVDLPDLTAALGEGWTQVTRDTLGEFLLMAYLETDLAPEQAALAAEGWGGDSYSLLKGPQDQNLLYALITWDAEEDAQEFFDTFLDFMGARTGTEWAMLGDDEKTRVMELPDQSIFVQLDLAETLLIFAPDTDTLETARSAATEM